jgi:hypothetical protein
MQYIRGDFIDESAVIHKKDSGRLFHGLKNFCTLDHVVLKDTITCNTNGH